jgi:hypothetical protein
MPLSLATRMLVYEWDDYLEQISLHRALDEQSVDTYR